jgi:hypothetical protein
MVSNANIILRSAPGPMEADGLERLDIEVGAAYWMRFLNGRWLIYWHERLIGDFPAENAALALDFLRQKQSGWPVHR